MYKIVFSKIARKDYDKLRKESAKLVAKMMDFIFDIFKHPFTGLGKPEALKGDLQGYWSRKINDKHRLVYKFEDGVLYIASCYGHYGDK